MALHRVGSVVVLLLLSTAAFAADVVAFAPENVVVVAPKDAPVSIASFTGYTDTKTLFIRVTFRNDTEATIDAARMAMMVFDGKREVIGAATHRAAGNANPGETFDAKFELPLMRSIDAAWQVVVVPVEASLQGQDGWRVPGKSLRPLVERLRGGNWSGAQQALAMGADLIPGGERVQIYPPNCTLMQCQQNNSDCYEYCYDLIACAYCDRRRNGEGCSTTCYCIGPTQNCPPDPYL